MDFKSKKALIATNDWFRGPDGQSYKGAWGQVDIVRSEDLLGVKPYNYTNWFAVVDGIVLIAGCQIHYAVICEERPVGNDIFIAGSAGRETS